MGLSVSAAFLEGAGHGEGRLAFRPLGRVCPCLPLAWPPAGAGGALSAWDELAGSEGVRTNI